MKTYRITSLLVALGIVIATQGACSSMKSILAIESEEKRGPIENPFGAFYSTPGAQRKDAVVLRSKKGEQSVEVELPAQSDSGGTDFVVPMTPGFTERTPASLDTQTLDERYRDRKPGPSDRDISHTFPRGTPEDEGNRREIEGGLGLVEAEDPVPKADSSYLAALDRVKQLFKLQRYEAALLESDELLIKFPTDPKIHEMRGTLLERMGHADLAMRSWEQALKFNPNNAALRNFVERKRTIQSRRAVTP